MFKFRYFLFISFCVTFYGHAKATHNRAGEITYKWLYGFTYEIKVTTYTNIGGTNLADRCEDTVYFGDGAKAIVLRSNGPTGPCSPAKEGIPITATIKLNEYITTHTYLGPGNYIISMQDPNRNASVVNIPNSVNQAFYIESLLVIPAFGSNKNNSPILTFPPIDNGCVTQCFFHNPGAYDTDGDSISYELTTCKNSQGVMCPGYSFPTTGGGVFDIDSLTGTLTWCNPQLQGLYNLAIIIKEWRLDNSGNYFIVGYVVRDMQIAIGNCNNTPPRILFNNLDTCILAGTTLTNTINADDVNGDNISLSANGNPFVTSSNPSSFLTTPSNSVSSGTFNWNTDSSHIRRLPYQVTLKVNDNNSVTNLVHFKTFNIKILPYGPQNLTTTASINTISLKWNKPLAAVLSGANMFYKYKVFRKTGLSNWTHNSNETEPPANTGFSFIGYTSNNISDTIFNDNNGGNLFVSGQDYSYLVLAEYTDGTTSYASNISSTQAIVGIEELNLNTKVHLYPNPTNKDLNISFGQYNEDLLAIELIDVTGRKIKTLTYNSIETTQPTITINLENLTKGIYFLKITGNQNTSITKKIIKQ